MFIIRTIFFVGLIILVLPADGQSKQQLALTFGAAVQDLSTLCQRNRELCRSVEAAWGMAKDQAIAGVQFAGAVLKQQLQPQPAASMGPPEPAPRAQGTLTRQDMAPVWRAGSSRQRG
jgi:hypothetical protein